jgi:hypothetical protein
MFSHSHVGRARAFGRFVTHPPIGFLAFLQRGRETIARFHDFFSGRVGGDSDKGARVLGKFREVIPNGFSLFIHIDRLDFDIAKNSLRWLPRRLRPGRKFFGVICLTALFRDRKIEGRAIIDHAFRPGPAAVPMNDVSDVCQADADSFKFLIGMQALEHAKEFMYIHRIKPSAVIANEDDRLVVTAESGSDLDASLGSNAREFHGIGDQIYYRVAE